MGRGIDGRADGLEGWLRRRRTLIWGALALIVAGFWRASHLPLEWVPTLELPRVTVSLSWPGTSPRLIEQRATVPIERALEGIAGVGSIHSLSRFGRAHLSVELQPGRPASVVTAEIADRLAALRPELPAGIEPRVDRQIPEELRDEVGFMTLHLLGPVDGTLLRRLAREEVEPRLRALPGIADLSLEGGREQELRIAFDDARLRAHALEVEPIRQLLSETLSDRSYGRLREGGRALLLLSPAADDLATLAALPLRAMTAGQTVRLGDVASLALDAAPARSLARIDGQPVVSLVLERTPDSGLLATSRRVRQALGTLGERLPPGVEVRVADDRADPVRDNLRQLAVSGAASLVLIAAVLFGMLGRGRSVAAVAFSVLFSLALALAAMKPLGLSLNLLTLAGLAMVVGLLVDNAVVVVERLTEERRRHGPTKALRRTWGVVAVPLLGGTLTTLAVLAPLVWASGELRALFASFAVLTALTLLASLFAALLLVPLVIESGGPPTRQPTTRRWCPRGLDLPLAWANRWPLPTLVLLALLLGTPIHSLPEPLEEPARGWSPWHRQVAERYNATLGSDVFRDARRWLDPLLGGVLGPFLEQVHLGRRWSFTERPEVRARLTLPTGSGLGRSDRLIAELERRALGSPVVRHTLVRVSEDQATLRVLFNDGALASREPLRLRQELIETVLHWADVEVSIGGLVPQGFHSGLGEVASFVVEAHGPSWNTLGEVADTLDRRLRRDHRVVEVDTAAGPSGPTRGHEVLALGWPSDAQARTGVDPRSLAQRLRLRLWTHGASFEAILGETGESIPVRLQIAGSETWSLDDLLTTPLAAEGQAPVRLGDAAVLGRVRQPLAIERRDQQYRRILRVYYRGPRDQGEKLIDHELANLVPPPGHRLERPTDTFLTDTVRLQLWLLLAATALAVLLVMAAVFESWRLPWLVLVSLPLALVGVAMGFLWSGADFAEGAFIGLVLLTGIAVNDAILLVDRQRRLRRRRPRLDPGTLAHLAVRQRLRPMWTTTLTSIAGVAPLLLIAEAGDFWLGFAVTVAGGLASSTLLVPPAIVALCAGARRRPRSAPSRRAWRRPWALASD